MTVPVGEGVPLTVTVTESAWAVVMLAGEGVTVTVGVVAAELATTSSSFKLWTTPHSVVPIRFNGKFPKPSEAAEMSMTWMFWLPPGERVTEAGNDTPIAGLPFTLKAMAPLKPFTELTVSM